MEREVAPEGAAVVRPKVILVCGPWSGGTSAVAGFIARLGAFAPGPFVIVEDTRTPETHEMIAFQAALKLVADERALRRTMSSDEVLRVLREFRDGPFTAALSAHRDAPVVLKHGLAALVLPELSEVFDLHVVGVVRPLEAIEKTRVRRQWPAQFGAKGGGVIYQHLFGFLIHADVRFEVLRYGDLLESPARVCDRLALSLGLRPSATQREEALAFVTRR